MGYARKDIEKTKKIAKKFVRYQKEGRALQHLLFYTIIIKVASGGRSYPQNGIHHKPVTAYVCTRVWGIGIPIKRLTQRYAVAIKWRYGNTRVDLALIYKPSYIYKRWRGKIQGVREKNFRKIKITLKLDF